MPESRSDRLLEQRKQRRKQIFVERYGLPQDHPSTPGEALPGYAEVSMFGGFGRRPQQPVPMETAFGGSGYQPVSVPSPRVQPDPYAHATLEAPMPAEVVQDIYDWRQELGPAVTGIMSDEERTQLRPQGWEKVEPLYKEAFRNASPAKVNALVKATRGMMPDERLDMPREQQLEHLTNFVLNQGWAIDPATITDDTIDWLADLNYMSQAFELNTLIGADHRRAGIEPANFLPTSGDEAVGYMNRVRESREMLDAAMRERDAIGMGFVDASRGARSAFKSMFEAVGSSSPIEEVDRLFRDEAQMRRFRRADVGEPTTVRRATEKTVGAAPWLAGFGVGQAGARATLAALGMRGLGLEVASAAAAGGALGVPEAVRTGSPRPVVGGLAAGGFPVIGRIVGRTMDAVQRAAPWLPEGVKATTQNVATTVAGMQAIRQAAGQDTEELDVWFDAFLGLVTSPRGRGAQPTDGVRPRPRTVRWRPKRGSAVAYPERPGLGEPPTPTQVEVGPIRTRPKRGTAVAYPERPGLGEPPAPQLPTGPWARTEPAAPELTGGARQRLPARVADPAGIYEGVARARAHLQGFEPGAPELPATATQGAPAPGRPVVSGPYSGVGRGPASREITGVRSRQSPTGRPARRGIPYGEPGGVEPPRIDFTAGEPGAATRRGMGTPQSRRAELMAMSRPLLQGRARGMGLPIGGSKGKLVDRIIEAERWEGEPRSAWPQDRAELEAMSRPQLQNMARRQGLKVGGSKADLVNRIAGARQPRPTPESGRAPTKQEAQEFLDAVDRAVERGSTPPSRERVSYDERGRPHYRTTVGSGLGGADMTNLARVGMDMIRAFVRATRPMRHHPANPVSLAFRANKDRYARSDNPGEQRAGIYADAIGRITKRLRGGKMAEARERAQRALGFARPSVRKLGAVEPDTIGDTPTGQYGEARMSLLLRGEEGYQAENPRVAELIEAIQQGLDVGNQIDVKHGLMRAEFRKTKGGGTKIVMRPIPRIEGGQVDPRIDGRDIAYILKNPKASLVLAEGIEAMNEKVDMEGAKKIVSDMAENFDDFGTVELGRVASEVKRGLRYMPDWIRVGKGGRWLQVNNYKADEYIEQMLGDHVAARRAMNIFFGQNPEGGLPERLEAIKTEMKGRGIRGGRFNEVVRLLGGMQPARGMIPEMLESSHPVVRDLAETGTALAIEPIRAAGLTASAFTQLAEFVFGRAGSFYGYRTSWPGLGKSIIGAAARTPGVRDANAKHELHTAERTGAIMRQIVSHVGEPGQPIRNFLKAATTGLHAMNLRWLEELGQHRQTVNYAKSMADRWAKRAELRKETGEEYSIEAQPWSKQLLDWGEVQVLMEMGYPYGEAKATVEGSYDNAQHYEDTMRNAPAVTTGGGMLPMEQARARQLHPYRRLMFYDSYGAVRQLGVLKNFETAINVSREAYNDPGLPPEAKRAAAASAFGRFVHEHWSLGLMGAATIAMWAALSGEEELDRVVHKAKNDPGSLWLEGLGAGLGAGSAGAVIRGIERSGTLGDRITAILPSARAWQSMAEGITQTGRHRGDESFGETVFGVFETTFPLIKRGKEGLEGWGAVGQEAKELRQQSQAVRSWREHLRDEGYEPGYGGAGDFWSDASEERGDLLAQIGSDFRDGDWDGALDKGLAFMATPGADVQSLLASLDGMRVLRGFEDDLVPLLMTDNPDFEMIENKINVVDSFIKKYGQQTYDRLEEYDMNVQGFRELMKASANLSGR